MCKWTVIGKMHSKDEHLPVIEGGLFEESYDDSAINLSMETSVENHEEEALNIVCEDAAAGEMEFDEELPEGFIEVLNFIL
ncbi:hypothetical protein FQR65_LT11379 [Abscondita terminalis]|nr:hypothetical protein FQR65_LT11379 [Abscondita terminalis]